MRRGFAAIAVLSVALGWPLSAPAQGVFKCVVDGKTVYQASPCASGGRQLTTPPGPSEQAASEARSKADAEKDRATGSAAGAGQGTPNVRKPAAATVDCDALKRQRAFAYGQRNGAIRSTKGGVLGARTQEDEKQNDAIVDQMMADIQRLESRMAAAGCRAD